MVSFVYRSIISVLLLSVLLAAEVQAGTATFAVGSESTFINVFTRESRRNGAKVGRVRVDLREIEALCRESDRSFEGFVRLVPPARSGPAAVTVDCLRRVEGDKIVNVQARNEAASIRP